MEYGAIHPSLISSKSSSSYYTQNLSSKEMKDDPKKLGGMFEAIFYRMIFDQVRKASLDEEMFDSSALQQVRQMQDDEMAQVLGAQGHLGISDMITKYIDNVEPQNQNSLPQQNPIDKICPSFDPSVGLIKQPLKTRS